MVLWLWLWLRRGEWPTPRSIMGAVIAFAGLVLMLDILTGARIDGMDARRRRISLRHGALVVPVLAIGLLATALAYVLGITSTRMLGSRLASFVALSEVVAAMLFGWLLLGQLSEPIQLIGGGLVLVGVVVVKWGEPAVAPEQVSLPT